MKTMYILRGASGSGKSTFAYDLKGFVCSADNYFIQPDGSYKFNGAKLGEAHAACFRRAEGLAVLTNGGDCTPSSITIDNTNTKVSEMKPYYDLAIAHGYEVVIIEFQTQNLGRNVHGVPPEGIQKQLQRLANNPVPADWKCRKYTVTT